MYTQKESQHIHDKSSVALPSEVTVVPNMRSMSNTFGYKNLNYIKNTQNGKHTHSC